MAAFPLGLGSSRVGHFWHRGQHEQKHGKEKEGERTVTSPPRVVLWVGAHGVMGDADRWD